MIWSDALLLDVLGRRSAQDAVLQAIERVLLDAPRTADLGGSAPTTERGEAIAALIRSRLRLHRAIAPQRST